MSTAATAAAGTGSSGYLRARDIAANGDAAARAALAGEAGTAPEILYYLASDPASAVRAAVAANGATPAQADHKLSQDEDPEVRALLGRKLAALAPGLSRDEQDRLRRLSWETLSLLVADTAVMVRAAIADALKEMPDAPRSLILRLARDTEMPVAEPVIRLSPLLTEADLLALVTVPPVPATVTAVARRPHLSAALSDAIIANADVATVAVLLGNPSAAIRESTLDALIAEAAHHTEWQGPLVRRPVLSPRATRALSEIVADQLLAALAARPDLAPEVTADLREKVAQRLAAPPAAEESPPTEEGFQEAATHGDRTEMARLLARAAGVPEAAVNRAVNLRSAKALVSLCWTAGFSPQAAMLAQTVLGQIGPSNWLPIGPEDVWPLAVDEMTWQIELLTNRT